MIKVPITKPVFDADDLVTILKPLESGWVVQGPFVAEFEKKFANFIGARFAAACTSCTTGLHLALSALEIGPGDEVIVPAFTWVATANVVLYQGAKPIFCDIDLKTFNIDINKLEAKITNKTRAIIPVHLFGLPADMDPIMDLARAYKLFVVEDAACGFGTYYKNKHVGTIGELGAFSFHPRKAITTGEGGMVTSSEISYAEKIRSLRDHGASRSDFSRHHSKTAFLLSEFHHLGYNYRMTDIQAALGVSQMNKAAKILEEKQKRAVMYHTELKDLNWLDLPMPPSWATHSYQSYVCVFKPELPTLQNITSLHEKRNLLMARLEELGISTRQGTHAVIGLDFYRKKFAINPTDYPNAVIADHLSFALPLYPQMTDSEQAYVIDNLKRLMK